MGDTDMGEDTSLKAKELGPKQKHWVRGMFKRFTVTSCARGGGGTNNSLRENMEEKEILVVEPEHSDNNSIASKETKGGENKRRSNARSRDVEHVKFATKETPISERRSNARPRDSDQHVIVTPKEAQGMESRRNSNVQAADVEKVNVASKEVQVVESKRLSNVCAKDTDKTSKVAPQTPLSGAKKDPLNPEIKEIKTVGDSVPKKEDVIVTPQIPKSEEIKKCADSGSNDTAAITIQAFFRGHLARRACRALRSLVKLQAHVRGMYVRKQSQAATTCMKSLVRLQIRVRERQMLLDKQQQEA